MEKKTNIDTVGAMLLVGFSILLGMNQVMIKLVNEGMNPVFQAGLRSACAIVPVFLIALWRGKKLTFSDGSLWPGMLAGIAFAFEFFLLFQALDYTSVGRSSILFYTMPVWVAVAAHFLIDGERMSKRRAAGLALAVIGIAVALLNNDQKAGPNALLGDVFALLAATGWAAIAILARVTKLSKSTPEMQLIYQLIVSAPILLVVAFYFGETFREMTPMLWGVFTFQVLAVVSAGFVLWFWILSIYPASDMASFAFLTPLFGVLFGWIVFDEQLSWSIVLALIFVGAGIYLVNKKMPRKLSNPNN